ncbi:hypothetical protein BO996_11945 [Delftia sp. HK171]|uniref:DEAD/DEAH box helicase n=1 Tax=Delftia sp. HK171 TaxID=1920191 RepID=UPI0009039AF0|nr:DEAD/DEAH box helicase [Delftia sp. HK171]APE48508.1 hypothetical protein BO996_11945 [Delftia sp. HK171]
MFDSETAGLLESAPGVPGLNPQALPQLLTRHYAELVARRLRGGHPGEDDQDGLEWSLERIADTYEIIASVSDDQTNRRPAAFVAGTAQQILARENEVTQGDGPVVPIDRDQLSASMAAALLFFIAEQYADAYEAGGAIDTRGEDVETKRLAAHVRDLVRGRVAAIVQRASQGAAVADQDLPLQARAFRRLVSTLADGIEYLARYVLSEPDRDGKSNRRRARELFQQVLELSGHSGKWGGLEGALRTSYPGPAHLASLLLAASHGIGAACLTRLPAPKGSDTTFWSAWLRFRAQDNPYIWPNHREAIKEDFHRIGSNAVLVLPTGAGKTTVSTLKIAATLASGKKVVFLAPTHALAEQVTDDLQELFPTDQFDLKVSAEFDSLLVGDSTLQNIEVMTPEGCLAMLSYSSESFADVGLLVFDECHLLSPESKRIGRALDGMLCLLAFCQAAPDADLLFLSAMLRNGAAFGEWIKYLTGRDCAVVELLWKPSRQARGVVVYRRSDISAAEERAHAIQSHLDLQKGKAKSLRKPAEAALTARPYALWGLRHNWADVPDSQALTTISEDEFQLSGRNGRGRVTALPNANETAAQIAIAAAQTGTKSIVFVNAKNVSVSTAEKISKALKQEIRLSNAEKALWLSITAELGDSKHSVFGAGNFKAVPHNAAMLRIERKLSEHLYKRPDGAMAIIATPTLAQGLNLPAQLALLAGDKRTVEEGEGREDLEAHEVLNAAARAGRAGHLANGVVLLVPEPVVCFAKQKGEKAALAKLRAVLPEDDRCVDITDPLEKILDRIADGEFLDKEVRYTVNRLATIAASDGDTSQMDRIMGRSLGAFMARQQAREDEYTAKILGLWTEVQEAVEDEPKEVVLRLASKTGLPLDLLERLRQRLSKTSDDLPLSVVQWVTFIFDWLKADTQSRDHLLAGVKDAALKAAGEPTKGELKRGTLVAIEPGVIAWLEGRPFNDIERILKGDPDATAPTKAMCPRARALTSTFIARGLSFVAGVVSRMVIEMEIGLDDAGEASDVIRALSVAVRRGFDSSAKLTFANRHPQILSRVELHQAYADAPLDEDSEFD